jgi:hypothetical protein
VHRFLSVQQNMLRKGNTAYLCHIVHVRTRKTMPSKQVKRV